MTVSAVRAYHFIAPDFITQHSREQTGVGKTLTFDGELHLGQHGLHGARKPLDALYYANDAQTTLCLVEISGPTQEDEHKLCGQRRKILKAFDATQMLRLYAVECAKSVLSIFEARFPADKRPREAIQAAQRFALDPSDENRQLMQVAEAAALEAGDEGYLTGNTAVWLAAMSSARAASHAAPRAGYRAAAAAIAAAGRDAQATCSARFASLVANEFEKFSYNCD